MNISMTIDCTPEEARRLMGLPDMAPIHELYLSRLRQTMSEGLSPEMMESVVRSWMPVGEVGMTMWRQALEQMSGTGSK